MIPHKTSLDTGHLQFASLMVHLIYCFLRGENRIPRRGTSQEQGDFMFIFLDRRDLNLFMCKGERLIIEVEGTQRRDD